ncbi:hypothetical protein VCM_00169 [Pseudomonas phage VCM]|uniref:Uncharacterized protein n=1 Tax=Pseudomonas phage VCM TaxID=1729937 RepID=A0A0S4KWY2_9CAUD|nr:hypothetical protein VCM_00169 [Pseudomonas phage VCM]CUR44371.1 hypothetical protein VCM_00169 [Pseudomonas phage VCM]
MCNCQLCNDLRHLQDRGVSEEFLARYLDEGLEAEYNKLVLDGVWPSSVELLASALERALERRRESDTTTETARIEKGE